ncbi:peptidylprolyl isomerase [Croceivirga thetidis]|uniref:Periplasmic chaperone PpiD n=1 Tax=Croceivirga thetidis TaxID=2721623 RepID=A0ABX1GP39_9FLAO|nr:peptidylprolyl isomerase [Croceivirga thetidis]NKI31685.1 peptidylprolyl isomerase [Croceivirga thetidis]
MAILGNIRKRTTVLILIIGMALFAFVISGVFNSNDLGGAKVGSSIAEINGDNIPREEFQQKMERASRQYGPNFSSTQLVNTVYNQELRRVILNQQFDELGIDIESDQIVDYVANNPGYAQIPDFLDDSGVFNADVFKNAIADWRVNDPLRYDAWLQDEKNIMQSAKEQLYFNLVKAGSGATLQEGEFDYKLQSNKVDIQYVRVPYSSIADSTITISKDEISDYVKAHKDDYKQEPARDVRFVFFEEKASDEDINDVRTAITNLLDNTVEYNQATDKTDTILGFAATTDYAAFLDRNSDSKFDTIFKAKTGLPQVAADSIFALNIGEFYGPYRDGDAFKVTKMVAKKAEGSVKASHILFAYEGATRANPSITRSKAEAEAEAKKILIEAQKADADFAALARENSDGPSGPRGGDLGFFQEGVMADEFNDFCFGNPVGKVGLVETDFGFHIIKVDEKEDIVQVATLARTIEPSETTINNLFTETTKFEMNSTDAAPEEFTKIAEEGEFSVRPVNKLKALDENLPGLGQQRNIVRWAFEDATNVGDIKRFDLTNGYAVVQLTKKYKEGVMAPEDASATVLPILRKERKAEQIIAANQGKAFEAFASDNNVTQSTASALSAKSPTVPGAGREPLVVGTALAMNDGDTSGLIKGETGVFMVKVTKKEDAVEIPSFVTFANTLSNQNRNSVNTGAFNALKEKAEIEDNRADFY